MKCWMRFSHFSWKNTSPTESVSSTMRMSGSVMVAMAKGGDVMIGGLAIGRGELFET
jgi:hypothetical protein